MAVALRLLGVRAHSRSELRSKLRRKGCAPDAIEAAVERLAGQGYLDDAAFAESLVSRRSASRGPGAIAGELAAKGIDRETARAALAGTDREAQLEAALRLAGRAGSRDSRVLAGRLIRRGFDWDVVREACRQAKT